MMASTLLWLVFIGYAAGTAGFLGYLMLRRLSLARLGFGVVLITFVLHVVSYGMACVATRAMVVASRHGSFSLLALLTVLVFLALVVRRRLYILGAFVMPLVVLMAGFGAASPMPVQQPEVLRGALFPFHVVTSFTGFAGFVAAFGVALAYLIQEHQLKSRKPQLITYVLPPLDDLERLNVKLVALSVAVLGVGIVTGILFAHQTTGMYWPGDPKSTATLISWMIYVLALLLRAVAGWRGRRLAVMLIIGFVLVIVTFAGLSHLPVHRA